MYTVMYLNFGSQTQVWKKCHFTGFVNYLQPHSPDPKYAKAVKQETLVFYQLVRNAVQLGGVFWFEVWQDWGIKVCLAEVLPAGSPGRVSLGFMYVIVRMLFLSGSWAENPISLLLAADWRPPLSLVCGSEQGSSHVAAATPEWASKGKREWVGWNLSPFWTNLGSDWLPHHFWTVNKWRQDHGNWTAAHLSTCWPQMIPSWHL